MGSTEGLETGTVTARYVVVNLFSPRKDLQYGEGIPIPSNFDFMMLF
jgi:hypothetical protein